MRFVSFRFQQTEGVAALKGEELTGFLKTDVQYPNDLISILLKGEEEIRKAYELLLSGSSC